MHRSFSSQSKLLSLVLFARVLQYSQIDYLMESPLTVSGAPSVPMVQHSQILDSIGVSGDKKGNVQITFK